MVGYCVSRVGNILRDKAGADLVATLWGERCWRVAQMPPGKRCFRTTSLLVGLMVLVSAVGVPGNAQDELVDFACPNLEQTVSDELGVPVGELTVADMEELEELDARDQGIESLVGLEYATNLRLLHLGYTRPRRNSNEISNLEPLAGLTGLEELLLSSNEISSLEPLEELTNLMVLWLDYNKISDIEPLAQLTNLGTLILDGNDISDLQPLKELTSLMALQLGANEISDLQPLEELTDLRSLWLGANEISDLQPLEELTDLRSLWLDKNKISNLSPLAGLAHLEVLELWDNDISDLSPLTELSELRRLSLHSNRVSDLSPLEGLAQLEMLSLSLNEIADIAPLKKLSGLENLSLDSNQINDLSPLESLTQLERLSVQSNEIRDIRSLKQLTELRVLNLGRNYINDLSVLAQLPHVERLWLQDNEIGDISPLEDLSQLEEVRLELNEISDVSPLVANSDAGGLGAEDFVDIRYNYLDLTEGSDAMDDIQTLLDRGVGVLYEPQRDLPEYQLTIDSTEGGEVVTPGEGDFTYDHGEMVDLEADAGYEFVEWTGDIETIDDPESAETTIEMLGDYEVTAVFQEEYEEPDDYAPTEGWHLLSVPAVEDSAPVEVFDAVLASGQPLLAFEWVPGDSYVTPEEIDPGRGYWLYLFDEVELGAEAEAPTGDYEVALAKQGWHLVSTPTQAVLWEDAQFHYSGVEHDGPSEAVDAGLIEGEAFLYDSEAEVYQAIPLDDDPGAIEPWRGYWLKTLEDEVTVVLPLDQGLDPGSVPTGTRKAPTDLEPPAPPKFSGTTPDALTAANHPNPVTAGETTFVVEGLPVDVMQVRVVDLAGREVWQGKGEGNTLAWNTTDEAGRPLASGIYLYYVEARVGGEELRTELERLLIVR